MRNVVIPVIQMPNWLLRIAPMLSLVLLLSGVVGAAEPGNPVPDAALLSDQKPGSVLFYNLYRSSFAATGVTVTEETDLHLLNAHESRAVTVRLFLVNGATGAVRSESFCLGANQGVSLLASQLDPGVGGYAVAVAIDAATGCPVSHNFLLGNAYFRLATGHFGKLNAVAVAAQFTGLLGGCGGGAGTANLIFDGSAAGYNRLPRALALESFNSRADGNDTLLVVQRVSGNLAGSVGNIGAVAGVVLDGGANEFEFNASLAAPQLRTSLTNNFPPLEIPLEVLIPAGGSGWLKLWATTELPLLGAALNLNQNSLGQASAFNTARNLVPLTLTASSSLTVPVNPQLCAERPVLTQLTPGLAAANGPALTLSVRGNGFTSGARVLWNGAARATAFVSVNQLTASIPASDLAVGSVAEVAVTNGAGPPSNGLRFTLLGGSGPVCNYALSAAGQTFGAGGGNGSVAVTTLSNCAWTVSSSENWLTITSARTNTGSGAVGFTVAQNAGANSRSGVLSVAGQSFTVTQAGAGNPGGDLAVDDGTFETAVGYPSPGVPATSYFVNRLTPNSYPATLNAVVIYLPRNLSGLTPGQRLGIVAGNNVAGGENIDRTPLQIDDGLIQTLDAFNVFPIRPVTITAGDFVVGFQLSPRTLAYPAALDFSPPSRRRSYASINGTSFQLFDTFGAEYAGNLAIRARLAATSGNPVPVLSSLQPDAAAVGSGGFTLTVNGANFTSATVVRWNGSDRATAFVNQTRLTAAISAADVAAAGTASVTVFTPPPGGGVSNAIAFPLTTTSSGPLPEQEPNELFSNATGLEMPGARTGAAALGDAATVQAFPDNGPPDPMEDIFVLNLTRPSRLALTLSQRGSNPDFSLFLFSEAENRLLHSSTREGPVTERITTQNVLLPGRYFVGVSIVSGSGEYTLAVIDPDGGGQPLPALTGMNPVTARVNSAGFVLQLTGEDFVPGSVVRWNGNDRATLFSNSTQLTATIPASDLAVAGNVRITVFNPGPGGGLSNTLNFSVTLSALSAPPRAAPATGNDPPTRGVANGTAARVKAATKAQH